MYIKMAFLGQFYIHLCVKNTNDMSIKAMPVWKWALLLLASLVLAFVVMIFGKETPSLLPMGWLRSVAAVVCAVAMLALYALFVRWFEGHPAQDIPLRRLAPETGKGLGVGFFFFVAVVGVMYACRVYRVASFGTDQPSALVNAFFFGITTAVGEELLFRGVLFRWVDEKWNFAAALVVSSLVFGLIHLGNSGATWWSSLAIAIEAGLLLGAAYKCSGTLWLPIGIHWAWNFTQGNFFGINVSGGDVGASLIQPEISGPDILTGGTFGAEASVIAVVLGAALSAWYIAIMLREKK